MSAVLQVFVMVPLEGGPGGVDHEEGQADEHQGRRDPPEVTTGGFAEGALPTDYTSGIPTEAKKDPNFPFYGSDIKLRTRYVLNKLARTFEAAGSSLDHVIKAQVFLEDLNNFSAFDEVWKEFFKTPPARTTVETSALPLKDAMVLIDLIGYVPGEVALPG